MNYDFGKFIAKSKISCITKLDFISMIDNDRVLISENNEGRSDN